MMTQDRQTYCAVLVRALTSSIWELAWLEGHDKTEQLPFPFNDGEPFENLVDPQHTNTWLLLERREPVLMSVLLEVDDLDGAGDVCVCVRILEQYGNACRFPDYLEMGEIGAILEARLHLDAAEGLGPLGWLAAIVGTCGDLGWSLAKGDTEQAEKDAAKVAALVLSFLVDSRGQS